MLTQKLGPESQPVAYLSKRLNPTASLALKSAVIAVLIEDALKLSLFFWGRGNKLVIFNSHQMK